MSPIGQPRIVPSLQRRQSSCTPCVSRTTSTPCAFDRKCTLFCAASACWLWCVHLSFLFVCCIKRTYVEALFSLANCAGAGTRVGAARSHLRFRHCKYEQDLQSAVPSAGSAVPAADAGLRALVAFHAHQALVAVIAHRAGSAVAGLPRQEGAEHQGRGSHQQHHGSAGRGCQVPQRRRLQDHVELLLARIAAGWTCGPRPHARGPRQLWQRTLSVVQSAQ